MSKGYGGQVTVLKGMKRVPPAKNLNKKEGCTLMVTMDVDSSQLLAPHTIFTGESLHFNASECSSKNYQKRTGMLGDNLMKE